MMRLPQPLIALIVILAALATAAAEPAAAQRLRRPPDLHRSHPGDHMVSWVILSESYVSLNLDKLRFILDEAFPGEFVPQREQGSFVIEGPVVRAQFLIQSRVAGAAGMFMLNSIPGPYAMFSDFVRHIEDQKTRRAAAALQNWLSIDLMAKHTTDEDAYRFIGRALATLAPRDAAFLVHPTRRIVITFDDDVRRKLASGALMP